MLNDLVHAKRWVHATRLSVVKGLGQWSKVPTSSTHPGQPELYTGQGQACGRSWGVNP